MADQVELTVPESLDGLRVDKAVASIFDISRTRATAVLDRGVSIDGSVARPSDRVKAGQTLVCFKPEALAILVPEEVDFAVRLEDDHVLVVDKPPGVVVHPGARPVSGTLAAGLIFRYPELVGVGQQDRWGLVHRLDRDTSGLILVGRDEASYENLVDQLRRRLVQRTYTALVEGRLDAPTGTVDAPIGRDPLRPTRRALSHAGKAARTHFEVVRYFPDSDCSLLLVRLETGRTHQIRVHLASIGNPVVSDRTYGATRKDLKSPRTFLHASKLGFEHPFSGEPIEVESALPDDLASTLDGLAQRDE